MLNCVPVELTDEVWYEAPDGRTRYDTLVTTRKRHKIKLCYHASLIDDPSRSTLAMIQNCGALQNDRALVGRCVILIGSGGVAHITATSTSGITLWTRSADSSSVPLSTKVKLSGQYSWGQTTPLTHPQASICVSSCRFTWRRVKWPETRPLSKPITDTPVHFF